MKALDKLRGNEATVLGYFISFFENADVHTEAF